MLNRIDDARRMSIADRLLSGDPPARIIDDLCVDGFGRIEASAEVAAALESPYVEAGFERRRRSSKLASYLDLRYRMWTRSGQARIFETSAIDPATFERDFYLDARPVLIRGAAAHWPAVQTWSPAYFAQHFGEATIEFTAGSSRYRGRKAALRALSLGEFSALVDGCVASNEFYVTANSYTLGRNTPLSPLRDDLAGLAFLADVNLDAPDGMNLWFGPRGTITPLHHDVMNVVFVQVYGTKELRLAHPFALNLLYNTHGVYSDVDPAAVDERRFPRALGVTWLRAEVNAGDALFIPAGWWHWVFAKSPSISVSFANFSVNGKRDLLPARHGTFEPALTTVQEPA